MKRIIFLVAVLLAGQFCFGQPTQTENEKKMKAASLEIERLKKDPKYSESMKNMPNIDSIMKVRQKGAMTDVPKTKIADTSFGAIPPANTALLRFLPIRVFNKAELVSYLHNLNAKLTELLRTGNDADLTGIPDNTITRSGTSIAFWLMGQPYKSVLVALKAAEIKPDNVTLLNNIGGLLTSSGLAVNAIPVLQYADQQQPGNNMIQNNLGQAFLLLGDTKKAEQYLLQSISTAKYYPDANLALAYIYNKRGDKASAIRCSENSLRGAYSSDAHAFLLKLKPDAKLMDYVRHRYKQPEFFNYHKYPLLPPCLKVEDAPVLKPQYEAYHEMLFALNAKYGQIARDENEIAKKTLPGIMMKAVKANRIPYRPFAYLAMAVLADLWGNEYTDKFTRHDKYKKEYHQQIKILDDKYEAEMKALNDRWAPILNDLETGSAADRAASKSVCNERNELGNKYLPLYDSLTEAFQQTTIKLYNNYLNDWSYWSYIASIDDHSYKAVFYQLAATMIQTLEEINQTKFIYPCTDAEDDEKRKATQIAIEEPDCFFKPKVALPFGVVNLEISCEGYKLEAGEGLIGKIEYSLQSGDITVAFGAGAKAPKLFFEGGGVEGGAEGEVKSQFFITFTKGHPTDWGVLWEAELKAKIGVGGVETSVGIEDGLTAGVGSGIQVKENGPLKYLVDKMAPVQVDDKQINKNVPLYKK